MARRRAPRQVVRMLCQAVRERDFSLLGELAVDISEGGMLLLSEQTCKQNEEVTVRFALPIEGRITVCKANVQWVRARPERTHSPQAIGLEFIDVSSEVRASLGRYVALMTGALKEPVEPMPVSLSHQSGEMPTTKATIADSPAALLAQRKAVGG